LPDPIPSWPFSHLAGLDLLPSFSSTDIPAIGSETFSHLNFLQVVFSHPLAVEFKYPLYLLMSQSVTSAFTSDFLPSAYFTSPAWF
jgi:hypothetical protein